MRLLEPGRTSRECHGGCAGEGGGGRTQREATPRVVRVALSFLDDAHRRGEERKGEEEREGEGEGEETRPHRRERRTKHEIKNEDVF